MSNMLTARTARAANKWFTVMGPAEAAPAALPLINGLLD